MPLKEAKAYGLGWIWGSNGQRIEVDLDYVQDATTAINVLMWRGQLPTDRKGRCKKTLTCHLEKDHSGILFCFEKNVHGKLVVRTWQLDCAGAPVNVEVRDPKEFIVSAGGRRVVKGISDAL